MTSREAVFYFVARARENGKAERRARRQEIPELASWLEGKKEAYLQAARVMKGRKPKVTLHWLTGKAVK